MKKTTKEFMAENHFTFGPNDTYVINGYRQKIECNVVLF